MIHATPTPTAGKWPKRLPQLTAEQQRIRDDFMREWLRTLPTKYGMIERFNHGYPLRSRVSGCRTLEIGAGIGAHLAHEDIAEQEYYVNELRAELADILVQKHPGVKAAVGDCQQRLDFADGFFDRVLAIHVLEHLPDLPRAIAEVHRLLKPEGRFSVVIPCEGGLAYTLARNISARPMFEKRYGQSYDWFVAAEHINRPHEIIDELERHFIIRHRSFFPLKVPVVTANLVIGLTLQPKPGVP
ncbi:MAG: class I SAM-dependent methyltransferase [Planctomycetes bacterium]|nr:class I SAM-dependent methyltransferase [Planctomycetota bacterium]